MSTAPANSQRNVNALMRILVFTLILSVMNGTMFNVALPAISQEFSLSPSQVSWIVTGYLIVYAIGTVTFGKLSEKYSLKNLLTFGLCFLTIGSLIGLIADSYGIIIVARILQAIGASVIPAVAMIIPVRYFAPDKRGRALGTTAIGVSLGSAIGPITAGFVTSVWSWHLLFAIPMLSLLTLPFYRKYLDNAKGSDKKIDLLGGALLAGTVAALLLALSNLQIRYIGFGIVLLILFIWRIRSTPEPFIAPAIFRNRAYSSSLVFAFFMIAISSSIPFIAPQLLAGVYGFSPVMIGIVMLPSALITAFLGKKGGKLADEKGNGTLLYIASTLLIVGFLCLSSVVGLSPIWIAVFLILGVLGQSFMQITWSNAVSQALTPAQVGTGMGLLSMSNFIAMATVTAVIGKVLDLGTTKVRFNPFISIDAGFLHSNILMTLAFLTIGMTLLYRIFLSNSKRRKV
ncbi:MFS transporter [Saccharibacillus sp. JS10]|uniref:MFS transporter n=1 Tax=Saccharibacillus sp. JS10 TaxID=2950552 RepID=UPI00210AFE35|nr:MFS transporter [Saccharibacillus sp. JS10]MCQ4086719.1 MFS transporter [Saccharibacillus sp. JS10]